MGVILLLLGMIYLFRFWKTLRVTLISPLFTYLLLVYVSGIRILEYNGDKKWGHLDSYKEYKKNTPRLLGYL